MDENFGKLMKIFFASGFTIGDIDPDDSLLAQLGEADIEIAKSRYIEIEMNISHC